MDLDTPESQTIAAVMRDYKPDLIGDFHEYKEEGESRVLLGNPDTLHRNVDPAIRDLSRRLFEYAKDALEAREFATGLYPTLSKDANEAVLRQQAALRHSPSLLVETPRRGALSSVERVAAQRTVAEGLLKMVREERRRLASTTAASARNAIAKGSGGRSRYYYRSPSRYSDKPPCGYSVTEDEYRDVAEELRLHGVTATHRHGAWRVTTAQASQPTIGLLLDDRAPEALTEADPIAC